MVTNCCLSSGCYSCLKDNFPGNLFLVPPISKIKSHSVLLENSEEEEVDVIVFCTVPFLDSALLPIEDNGRIVSLYRRTISPGFSFALVLGTDSIDFSGAKSNFHQRKDEPRDQRMVIFVVSRPVPMNVD